MELPGNFKGPCLEAGGLDSPTLQNSLGSRLRAAGGYPQPCPQSQRMITGQLLPYPDLQKEWRVLNPHCHTHPETTSPTARTIHNACSVSREYWGPHVSDTPCPSTSLQKPTAQKSPEDRKPTSETIKSGTIQRASKRDAGRRGTP